MAKSDNTMVLRGGRDNRVLARAMFSENFVWSIETGAAVGLDPSLEILKSSFQRFTNNELEGVSPADGEPQAVLVQLASQFFGWEVERINPSELRSGVTP